MHRQHETPTWGALKPTTYRRLAGKRHAGRWPVLAVLILVMAAAYVLIVMRDPRDPR
jgi:ABC-type dipeptide/oligopeptide/nickel transport system permease subunit